MDERGLKMLKNAVIFGGVLLVVATIMLFVVLAKKIGASGESACKENPTVTLPAGQVIVQTQVEKNKLHLTVQKEAESYSILTIDRCSGDITDTLHINAPRPKATMPFG